MDKSITRVQIASIPDRVENLELTLASLLPQVDSLYVALNNYGEAPPFLDSEKIEWDIHDNSLGDGAKFYGLSDYDGYVLTCDDDLVYPEGYVRYMVGAVDRYGCIVTLLGKQYATRPIVTYSNGYTRIFNCLNSVRTDDLVDVGGTGVMAFHTDIYKPDPHVWPRRNMSDVWVAKEAQEQGIKIMSISHPKGYLKYRRYDWRIWAKDRDNKYQTEVINGFLK